MANEGVTTAATIKGDLKLDIDDWKAKIAIVKADADELAGKHPTVKVDANTSAAQASLAAVDAAAEAVGATSERTGRRVKASANDVAAAEAKMAAAGQAATLAAKAEELAAMRLEDAQSKRGRTDITVAAAELALERATARTTAAQEKNVAAGEALAATRAAAATSAAAEAAAQDGETGAINKTNAAQNGHIQRWQMILGLIVTLIPLLAPLAGYIVGVGGALAGMGAAGVLAIVGVVQAMKQGTLVGQQYSAGLQSLKSDLSTLGGTAAVHLLGSFRDGVYQINQALPELNREIGGFADQLGGAASTVLQGVITAFRVLNPLFVQGGIYVQQLADGFQQWTQDGGLQKFADYAQRELPQVAQTLGALASAAMHLIVAFAPIGTVMLTMITAVANAISWIDPTVLDTVAVGALAVFAAYKTWNAIPGIIGRVKTSMSMLGGALPIVGIVAVVNELLVLGGSAVANAVNNMTGLSAAFKEVDDAIASGDLGTPKLQKTVTGLRTMLTQMRGDLGGYMGFLMDTSKWFHDNGLDWLGGPMQAVVQGTAGKAQTEIDKVVAAQKAATAATGVQANAQMDLARTYGMSLSAWQAAATAQKTQADQARATTAELRLENDAASLLTNALTILNGGALDVAQAQTGLAAANNQVTDAFTQNGTAINGSSKAAVANQQALQSQVQAAQQAAEAIGKQTGSSEKAVAALAASKTALEANLRAQGELTPAVQAYIDKLYDLKDLKVPPTKLDVDNANALKVIAATKNALNVLNGRTVTVYIEGQQVGDFGHINVGSASTKKLAYAGGGTIAGPGSRTADRIMVAVSDSEEVVSNDRGQADKWRPTLKLINQDAPAGQIAGRMVKDAGMSTTAAPSVPQVRAGDFNITLVNPVSRDPIQDIRVAQQMKAAEMSYVQR